MVATYGYFWVEEIWGGHIALKPEASHILVYVQVSVSFQLCEHLVQHWE